MVGRFRLPERFTNTFVYLSTVFVNQFAGFILLPILTRFLAPSQYGEYAVALAIGGLIGMFASAWMRNVGFRFYFDAKTEHATRAFFWSLSGLQALVVVVVFGIITLFAALAKHPFIGIDTLLALAVMTLASDLAAWSVTLLRGEKMSGRFAVAEFTMAAVRIVGTLAGLLVGFRSPSFLFLATAAATGTAAIIAVITLHQRLEGRFSVTYLSLWQVARRAPTALPFSIGEWLNRLSDRLILQLLSTSAIVGIYSAGQGLGDRVVSGLVGAVFMMAWPDVLNAWNDGGMDRARVAIERYIQIFLTLTVGPVMALVLYAGTLVHLLGSSYESAVHVVAIIGIASWMRGLGNCFNRHFELQKAYWKLSGITLAGAAINVGLTFLWVPRWLGVGAALATLVSQALVTVVFVLFRDRELVRFPFADAGYVVAAVALPAAVAWPLLGESLGGLAVFAVGYAAVMGVIWVRRFRSA